MQLKLLSFILFLTHAGGAPLSNAASGVPSLVNRQDREQISKRLTDIICDPVNSKIKPITREKVQAVINYWENWPEPTFFNVGAKQEFTVGYSLSVVTTDRKERAAMVYANVVSITFVLNLIPRPLTCLYQNRVIKISR